MLRWNQVFMQFFASERDGEAPFFLARNRIRPYTYPAAMADLKERCVRVGVDGSRCGLHGIRVAGYDASVRANGHEVTICHGLWAGPASANRHHRFDVSSEIVPMAANMVRYHTVGERRVGFESSRSGPECPTSIGSAADTALVENVVQERTLQPRRGSTPDGARQRKSSRDVSSEGTARRSRGARGSADFGSSPAPPSALAEVDQTTVLSLDVVLAGTQGGRRSYRVRHGRSQHPGVFLGH